MSPQRQKLQGNINFLCVVLMGLGILHKYSPSYMAFEGKCCCNIHNWLKRHETILKGSVYSDHEPIDSNITYGLVLSNN